jgi:hypothetical protein
MAETKTIAKPQKEKKKDSIFHNKIVWLGLAVTLFMWLMVFTNLPLLFGVPQYDLVGFQQEVLKFSILVTILFIMFIIFLVYGKGKTQEIQEKEGLAVVIVEPHTQFDSIRCIARQYHGLQLGHCIKNYPITPYKESGSFPTTRFFLFQVLDGGLIVGESLWRQDYIKKVVTTLMSRTFYGRNDNVKYWHGESRSEPFRSIFGESVANKKGKELEKRTAENDDESMTE